MANKKNPDNSVSTFLDLRNNKNFYLDPGVCQCSICRWMVEIYNKYSRLCFPKYSSCCVIWMSVNYYLRKSSPSLQIAYMEHLCQELYLFSVSKSEKSLLRQHWPNDVMLTTVGPIICATRGFTNVHTFSTFSTLHTYVT